MLKIDPNVPMPPRNNGGRYGARKYPFREMVVGDSFLIPSDQPKQLQRRVYQLYRYYAPMKFMTRMMDGGVRIWRIA